MEGMNLYRQSVELMISTSQQQQQLHGPFGRRDDKHTDEWGQDGFYESLGNVHIIQKVQINANWY